MSGRAILPRSTHGAAVQMKPDLPKAQRMHSVGKAMMNALGLGLHSGRLIVEEHRSLESFKSLEREWREVEAHTRTPFATWDWAVAWWAQLREEKLGVTDSLSIRSVRVIGRSGDGPLVAIAPMLISRRPSVGPIRVRQLQFFGADPNITEQRGMLALPEWEAEAYRALVGHALQHADDWDSLLLSGVPADLDLGELATSSDFEWVGQTKDYTLSLPDSWAAFRTALPRNIKESLRKCYNSLKRDGLEFRLQVAETVDSVEPALGHFFALHAARAKLSDTVHHFNIFSTAEAQGFLKDVCRRFAARGALRIFQLLIGEKVVAVRIGFVVGDTLYLYYSGYDPAFAQYSVMTTTVAEAIQYGIRHGFSRVNLSTGKDVSKARWDPTESVTRQALVTSSSRRAKIATQVYRHALHAIGSMPALRRATTFLARRSTPPAQPYPR
ncbi:MAG TPA: GNAT family N-acetyltransferase [Polyangiaceae bacterium]|nr:GNAT family N-acetyltransferase [Polyangiaceae bacterium]